VFCNGCLQGFFENSINQAKIDDKALSCPEAGCGIEISINIIMKLINDECKERYSRFMVR
jgi:hypothetical protein